MKKYKGQGGRVAAQYEGAIWAIPLLPLLDMQLIPSFLTNQNIFCRFLILLLILGMNIMPIYIYWTAFRYVAIDDGILYIKSMMPPFNRKDFLLKDIQKIIFKFDSNGFVCLQIEGDGIKYAFRTLRMGGHFMLCELVNDLRAQGIEVDFPHEIEDDVARQKRSWERQRQWKERMRQKKQDNNNKTQTL